MEKVRENAAEIVRVQAKYGYKDLPLTLLNWCKRDALKIVQRATFQEPAQTINAHSDTVTDPSVAYYSALPSLEYATRWGFRPGASVEEMRSANGRTIERQTPQDGRREAIEAAREGW